MHVDSVRQLIMQGCTIHMGFSGGGRVWWIESPYVEIDDDTLQAAAVGHNGHALLIEAGDSLFGWPGSSQTWKSAYA